MHDTGLGILFLTGYTFPHLGAQRDTSFLDSSLKSREIAWFLLLPLQSGIRSCSSLVQGSAPGPHLIQVQAASSLFQSLDGRDYRWV